MQVLNLMEIYRHACPRNCFSTCGMLSYIEDGKLMKISGDAKHGYNQGRLCAKGYAYTQYVYNPYRLKHPIRQTPRGSGNWKRISWEEAYDTIADKILELNERYGSNLASGYNKFSGNIGLLHYAVEGMFNSIGPHTKPIGNPCLITGERAMRKSFGQMNSIMPEKMAEMNAVVIWGANPAVTNVHQMKFILQARQKGAKLIVIDPIFTRTAATADIYIQINPGTDGWLALGVAKLLIESESYNQEFVHNQTVNWEEFHQYVNEQVDLHEVCSKTGISFDVICELVSIYSIPKPCATWIGFGTQRNENGGQNISAINTLALLGCHSGKGNRSVYYSHNGIDDFPVNLLNHAGPEHPTVQYSREININNFAENASKLVDPPLKFLWIALRNPLSQDQDFQAWESLMKELELIVTVDLFMTKSAELSDIVLPAASHFEEMDLNVSYWHHWLSVNEKAIPPYYEAKSDLQIARELMKKLNDRSPGFSNFPSERKPIDWIREELTPSVKKLYSIESIDDLLECPRLRTEEVTKSSSSSFKFRLFSQGNKGTFTNSFNRGKSDVEESYPFQLLTPQSLLKIHSQYEALPWLNQGAEQDVVELSEYAAEKNGILEGDKVELFNQYGKIAAIARISRFLPQKVVLVNQAGKNPINRLIVQKPQKNKGKSSMNFYDSSVNIRKWCENDG